MQLQHAQHSQLSCINAITITLAITNYISLYRYLAPSLSLSLPVFVTTSLILPHSCSLSLCLSLIRSCCLNVFTWNRENFRVISLQCCQTNFVVLLFNQMYTHAYIHYYTYTYIYIYIYIYIVVVVNTNTNEYLNAIWAMISNFNYDLNELGCSQ